MRSGINFEYKKIRIVICSLPLLVTCCSNCLFQLFIQCSLRNNQTLEFDSCFRFFLPLLCTNDEVEYDDLLLPAFLYLVSNYISIRQIWMKCEIHQCLLRYVTLELGQQLCLSLKLKTTTVVFLGPPFRRQLFLVV